VGLFGPGEDTSFIKGCIERFIVRTKAVHVLIRSILLLPLTVFFYLFICLHQLNTEEENVRNHWISNRGQFLCKKLGPLSSEV
jgi:hypothetical protein